MTPTVYLDTSVINFLFATDAPQLQAATVAFFERYVRAGKYRTMVSDFVLQELNQQLTGRLPAPAAYHYPFRITDR